MPLAITLIFFTALYASFTDAKSRVISNHTVVFAFLCCFIFAFLNGYLLHSFLIATLCFAFSFILWLLGFWGGGDAKYFPVMMVGVKPDYAIEAICYIGLFGGITVIGVYVYCLIAKKEIKKIGIPYGIPISASCCLFMLLSLLVLR
ncbi:TPA: prepilin peptidase [Vibrio vulnificus]|uniref:A24 family peptidase n=1 Tax=Vibrio vulnificus TaxID=672 RepID=UPI001A34BD2C|nr:prepilin peptidase [Vibrio vulnificus]EGQ8092758.1 pilus assembly protein CpaA [Vibrio vulnificus]EHH0745200.1 pilus assembly protein CpaA [Vibrio vulnificus]ELV8677148.1 prepilin peptidase [Vibrio vulnificus]MDS1778759.1 prepilin peptidase [Vibrio vulnificus]MDS1806229.1 prepilin peptidase [Vibrio vulnificus]